MGQVRLRLIFLILLLAGVFCYRFAVEIHQFIMNGTAYVRELVKKGNSGERDDDEQGEASGSGRKEIPLWRFTLHNGREITGIMKKESVMEYVVDIGVGEVRIAKSSVKDTQKLTDSEKKGTFEEWEEFGEDYEEDSGKAVIRYRDKDRIVVPVLIDGTSEVDLILDTGAPYLTLKPSSGNQYMDKNSKFSKKVEMKWTDKSTTIGRKVLLRSVKVGNLEAKNVIAIVCEIPILDSGIEGLLGMSFLEKFRINIDSGAKKIVLEKR